MVCARMVHMQMGLIAWGASTLASAFLLRAGRARDLEHHRAAALRYSPAFMVTLQPLEAAMTLRPRKPRLVVEARMERAISGGCEELLLKVATGKAKVARRRRARLDSPRRSSRGVDGTQSAVFSRN